MYLRVVSVLINIPVDSLTFSTVGKRFETKLRGLT